MNEQPQIDYSSSQSAAINANSADETECILVSFSSKLGRDGAEAIANLFRKNCPDSELDFEVHKHKGNYALEVRQKNVLKPALDPADQLLHIKRTLENAVTSQEEELHVNVNQNAIWLHIPAGTPIVSYLKSRQQLPRFIRSITPLHQPALLDHLQEHWVFAPAREILSPPLGQIRAYFGPEIALYFAWLAHFTGWLFTPAIIGTLLFLHQSSTNKEGGPSDFLPFVMFALFNSLWAIGFLRSWEQRQREIAEEWATKEAENVQEACHKAAPTIWDFNMVKLMGQIRADFWRPLDAYSLLSLLGVLLALLRLQDWAKAEFGTGWLSRTSVILQGLVCIGAEWLYRRLATVNAAEADNSDNDDADHDNALIARLALFQSISAFCPLFYIAFWLGDWQRLQDSLATLLITRQFVQNFTEIGVPMALGQLRLLQLAFVDGQEARHKASASSMKQSLLDESSGECQVALSEYGRPLDDYLEMFVQLGYVLLFSPAFPLAALCALANNLLEARVDAFKLCEVHRRPWPRRARAGIGGWQNAIKMMCLAGVWVNLALVLLRWLTAE